MVHYIIVGYFHVLYLNSSILLFFHILQINQFETTKFCPYFGWCHGFLFDIFSTIFGRNFILFLLKIKQNLHFTLLTTMEHKVLADRIQMEFHHQNTALNTACNQC